MQEDENIREAVLRDLIQKFLSARGQRRSAEAIRVIFVGVDGGPDPTSELFGWDPSDPFLARFSDIAFPIKSVSAALLSGEVRDMASGEPGVVFSAGSICWVGPREVEVQATGWSGMMSGASYTFHLTHREGKWVVNSREMNWVS